MGGRADGQAHLHRIAHADALEEGRQDDRADDAGDDNRNRGDGGYAAEHFGYRDRNRSCYRFRHERKRRAFAQTEQMAEEQHAADGYHRADERAEQDGQQVFQQYIQLAVNRDRKRYRCRCQEERDQLAGFLIGLVGGAGCDQQRTDQNRGNQQRIADRRTGFLLNLYAERIKTDGNQQPELRGGEKISHGRTPPRFHGAADGTRYVRSVR